MRWLCLTWAAAAALSVLCGVASPIVNTNVQRVVDASTAVVSVRHDIQFQRLGAETAAEDEDLVAPYVFALPTLQAARLAHLTARCNAASVPISPPIMSDNTTYYALRVPADCSRMQVDSTFTELLQPQPSAITQKEKQFVHLAYVSHYYYSLYPTEEQLTVIKLFSVRNASFAVLEPVETAGRMLRFGPYVNVDAMTVSAVDLRFINHAPFAKFERLSREFDLSPWGSIAVEEFVSVAHVGARLAGSFSRADYEKTLMTPGGEKSGPFFRELTALLPKHSTDIYYRDQIGNVSSSTVHRNRNGAELIVQTRFPLFGGWKTEFYVGYTINKFGSDDIEVTRSYDLGSRRHRVEIPIDTVFQNVWIEEGLVRVVLPEGSTDIEVVLPSAIGKDGYTVELNRTSRRTVLSNFFGGGRTVLNFKSSNIVDAHKSKDGTITIYFSLDVIFHMTEALLFSSAILLISVGVVVFSKPSCRSEM